MCLAAGLQGQNNELRGRLQDLQQESEHKEALNNALKASLAEHHRSQAAMKAEPGVCMLKEGDLVMVRSRMIVFVQLSE